MPRRRRGIARRSHPQPSYHQTEKAVWGGDPPHPCRQGIAGPVTVVSGSFAGAGADGAVGGARSGDDGGLGRREGRTDGGPTGLSVGYYRRTLDHAGRQTGCGYRRIEPDGSRPSCSSAISARSGRWWRRWRRCTFRRAKSKRSPRSYAATAFPYLILDARYERVRDAG
jgi:hypothetical protein